MAPYVICLTCQGQGKKGHCRRDTRLVSYMPSNGQLELLLSQTSCIWTSNTLGSVDQQDIHIKNVQTSPWHYPVLRKSKPRIVSGLFQIKHFMAYSISYNHRDNFDLIFCLYGLITHFGDYSSLSVKIYYIKKYLYHKVFRDCGQGFFSKIGQHMLTTYRRCGVLGEF